MPLKKLAIDDSLGNPAAHFFKSGHVLRAEESDRLAVLKELLPKKGPNNTNIEYDIWYCMGDKKRVHGYTYTDVLAKFMYLRVACSYRIDAIMEEAVHEPITEEGERIFEDVRNNNIDKYKLNVRKAKKEQHDFVIFLPGGNILDKIVNFEKVKDLVKNEGAKVKMHPISPISLRSYVENEFGEENIIDKKLSGHQILETCKKVGFCNNSEMGLLAFIKEKEVEYVAKKHTGYTYTAIYNAVMHNRKEHSPALYAERMKRIFSAKYSGLIPILIDNPQERIDMFFAKYKDEVHLAPKNSNP